MRRRGAARVRSRRQPADERTWLRVPQREWARWRQRGGGGGAGRCRERAGARLAPGAWRGAGAWDAGPQGRGVVRRVRGRVLAGPRPRKRDRKAVERRRRTPRGGVAALVVLVPDEA